MRSKVIVSKFNKALVKKNKKKNKDIYNSEQQLLTNILTKHTHQGFLSLRPNNSELMETLWENLLIISFITEGTYYKFITTNFTFMAVQAFFSKVKVYNFRQVN